MYFFRFLLFFSGFVCVLSACSDVPSDLRNVFYDFYCKIYGSRGHSPALGNAKAVAATYFNKPILLGDGKTLLQPFDFVNLKSPSGRNRPFVVKIFPWLDLSSVCNYFSFNGTCGFSGFCSDFEPFSLLTSKGIFCIVLKKNVTLYEVSHQSMFHYYEPVYMHFFSLPFPIDSLYKNVGFRSFRVIDSLVSVDFGNIFKVNKFFPFLNFFREISLEKFLLSCNHFSGISFGVNGFFGTGECLFLLISASGTPYCAASYSSFCGLELNLLPIQSLVEFRVEKVSSGDDVLRRLLDHIPEWVSVNLNSSQLAALLQGINSTSGFDSVSRSLRNLSVSLSPDQFKELLDVLDFKFDVFNTSFVHFKPFVNYMWDRYFTVLTTNSTLLGSRRVGGIFSWIADVIMSLVKPILEVFIEVISDILMAVITFFLDFEPLLEKLLVTLEDKLEFLIEVILRMLTFLLSLLLKFFVFVDVNVHVLEFLLIYLIVYYYSKNHFFCIFLMFVLVFLFGSNRFYPSVFPEVLKFVDKFQQMVHNISTFKLYSYSSDDQYVFINSSFGFLKYPNLTFSKTLLSLNFSRLNFTRVFDEL